MRRLPAWSGLVVVAFSSVVWAAAPQPQTPQSQQPPPPLLAEASATHEVLLAGVTQETVEFTLTVLNQSNTTLSKVVARLTDFRNAQLESFASTIDGGAQESQPFEVKGFQPHELRVQVKLPKPGEYSARFTLVANDKLYPSTVKITRVAPPLPTLDIVEIQPVMLKVPFLPNWSASETEKRKVTIRETAGLAAATLSAPELQSLTYKPKDNVAFAVPGRIVTTKENTVVEPKKSGEIEISVADIPTAGRYEATIRFPVEGAAPITKTLSILARQSWWVAAFFITLGVLLALALRIYLGVVQPRLALQSRVALLFQQLHEAALEAGDDLDARRVVERVRDSLAAKWDTLSGSAKLIGSTDFDVYEAKVPLLQNWVRLKKLLPKGLPDSVRGTATAAMAAAQQVLDDPTATAAAIEAQLGKLGALPAQIETAALAAAQAALVKLKAEFQASSDPDVQALQPALQEIADFAANPLPLEEKFAKLNTLRRKYVEVLSRSLLAQLNAKPPFDMDANVWSSARERAKTLLLRVETALDADAAVATYLEAVRSWLRPQLIAFAIDLRKKAAVGTVHQQQFLDMKEKVEALLVDVDGGKVEGALTRVAPLLDEYKQLLGVANSTMGPDAAAGFRSLTDAMKSAPAAGGVDLLRHFGSVPSAQQLSQRDARVVNRNKERLISVAAVAIILVLAVLVGVKALWAEDWTWGGGTAYLVAFLWGAGLSGFTYDGVSNLLKRFVP